MVKSMERPIVPGMGQESFKPITQSSKNSTKDGRPNMEFGNDDNFFEEYSNLSSNNGFRPSNQFRNTVGGTTSLHEGSV